MATTKKSAAPTRSAPPAPAFRVSPRDLWQMFRERWLLGLFIGALAGGAFFFLQPNKPPVYYSEISLLFEARKDRVLNIQEVVDTSVGSANELNVHQEQLRSQTFFDYLLASFSRDEIEKIQKPYRDPEHPDRPPLTLTEIMPQSITITTRQNTNTLPIWLQQAGYRTIHGKTPRSWPSG